MSQAKTFEILCLTLKAETLAALAAKLEAQEKELKFLREAQLDQLSGWASETENHA